jgi:hypothetical protein
LRPRTAHSNRPFTFALVSAMNSVLPVGDQSLSPRVTPRRGSKVTCRKGTLGLGPDIAVGLVDLSVDGAGLIVRQALRTSEEVELVLEGPGNARPIKRTATVQLCESVPNGHLIVVEFQKRLERPEVMTLT